MNEPDIAGMLLNGWTCEQLAHAIGDLRAAGDSCAAVTSPHSLFSLIAAGTLTDAAIEVMKRWEELTGEDRPACDLPPKLQEMLQAQRVFRHVFEELKLGLAPTNNRKDQQTMDNLQPGTAPKVTPVTHIAPTVGRVVWFWDEVATGDDPEQPMRADICHVNADGSINLSVNDHLGNQFTYVQCALHQGDAAGCSLPRPFATWMPYQKGQAAKAEAAEKVAGPSMAELQRQMQVELVRERRLKNDSQETSNEFHRMELEMVKGLEVQPSDHDATTVPGMPPHQARMRFERDELSPKLSKLKFFMGTDAFADLDEAEQDLLEKQCDAMEAYLDALHARIALFNEQQGQD